MLHRHESNLQTRAQVHLQVPETRQNPHYCRDSASIPVLGKVSAFSHCAQWCTSGRWSACSRWPFSARSKILQLKIPKRSGTFRTPLTIGVVGALRARGAACRSRRHCAHNSWRPVSLSTSVGIVPWSVLLERYLLSTFGRGVGRGGAQGGHGRAGVILQFRARQCSQLETPSTTPNSTTLPTLRSTGAMAHWSSLQTRRPVHSQILEIR